MYGRIYTITFSAISVAAAQDLLLVRPATNKVVVLHKAIVTPDDSETNQQLKTTIKRQTATLTVTGGTSVTPTPTATSNSAAGMTATRNHTTRTTTNGTELILNAESFPSQGGFEYVPDISQRPIFVAGEGLIFGLEEAPGSSIPMSGILVVEEIG